MAKQRSCSGYTRSVKGLTSRWGMRCDDQPGDGPLVERVLAARGLAGASAREFLDPRLTQLHDPSLMPDLDKAAWRLLDALARDEAIVIYGDYDVDGITATAIVYHTLRALSPNTRVSCYVPHRLEEGYGLNGEAIEQLAAEGARVIVSVDCGVTATKPAQVAAAAGVDLIITDHHHPPEREEDLPRAFAVVHPRRPGSGYPFGELSGAGVAYKLAWRLATMASPIGKAAPALRTLLVDLLAFAALGTIADIVPLIGENRVLATFGLVRARRSPFVGLRALVAASGLGDDKLGEMEVGFRLGPRLNAAGRMGHAKDAVELFTTATPARAAEIAEHLSKQNQLRRDVESAILEQACELAEARGMTGADRRAIVLSHESWHAGVVGIVCSRLVERYGRPTILMQTREGSCHGSGRSVDGFDLHAGLSACAEHLERFGGHTMAAGLHVAESRLEAFTEAFVAVANERIRPEELRRRITIDVEADAGELSIERVTALDRLAPFGAANPQVKLLVRGLAVHASPRVMGAQGKHMSVQLRATLGPARGRVYRAVAWNWGEHSQRLATGQLLDVVLTPKVSNWSGAGLVELEVRDVRESVQGSRAGPARAAVDSTLPI
jgi:single-stranded-DNA-specific exonuclease